MYLFIAPENMGTHENPTLTISYSQDCGDSVEMSFLVEGDTLKSVRFHTNGCPGAIACASAATILATNRTLDEATHVSKADIIEYLEGLPAEKEHCAEMALSCLQKGVQKLQNKEFL